MSDELWRDSQPPTYKGDAEKLTFSSGKDSTARTAIPSLPLPSSLKEMSSPPTYFKSSIVT